MNEQERAEFLTDKNEWVTIFRALGIPETIDYNLNSDNAKRVLCICRGGNCRSVALAFLLKYKYMCDAVSASLEKNNSPLLLTLANWADSIIVTESTHLIEARMRLANYHRKIFLLDLTGAARLRAHPFDIDFLKLADDYLGNHAVACQAVCNLDYDHFDAIVLDSFETGS